eukprot:s2257_g2.t1
MVDPALETLCAFLTTLGSTFDKKQWSGYGRWQEVFRKVELFADDKAQTPRIRCLLKDLLDKRRNGWQEKKVAIKAAWTGWLAPQLQTRRRHGLGSCAENAGCALQTLQLGMIEPRHPGLLFQTDRMGKKTVGWMDTRCASPPFSAPRA